MIGLISRRSFLAAGSLSLLQRRIPRSSTPPAGVDFHVHIDPPVTIEKALQLSRQRRVKFGVVEHAGSREFRYAGLLSCDDDIRRYLARLEGKPVYRGIQAEGLDWMRYFSREAISELDYVLSDALTFPDRDGSLVRLWTPGVEIDDKQDFMDRYTDFNVQVIAEEPIDIIANPTFLPTAIQSEYDVLWTPVRMKKIIDAAVKHRVAIEINTRFRVPSPAFLRMAKEAGAVFSFGSNLHWPNVGNIDYGLEMARQLQLTQKDLFNPAPPGRKPIQIRK